MPTWAWALIAVALVAVIALVAWQVSARNRTKRLRQQFGSEYDHTLDTVESKRDAETELEAREARRQQLQIRPLPQAARDRYVANWETVQAQFVDDPRSAVGSADSLIQSVMSGRGYPVDDFDQRAADISVDHPDVVWHYREGHRLASATAGGAAAGEDAVATEGLRQAMQHYRALFDELVEPDADEPTTAERGDRSVAARDEKPILGRKVS